MGRSPIPVVRIDHKSVFDGCSPNSGFSWLIPAKPPQNLIGQTIIIAGNVRQPLQASGAGISTPLTEETEVSTAKAVAEFPCIGKAKTKDITNNVAQTRCNNNLYIVQCISIGPDRPQEPIAQSCVRTKSAVSLAQNS